MTIVDPGNPDTSSFAVARLSDGSPLDPDLGTLGAATYLERISAADPAPHTAADIAAARLTQLGGAVATLEVRCVPQPWLQPGDVIAVEYNGALVAAQVVGWRMDLAGRSEMTVQLRAWRVRSDVDLPLYPTDPPGAVSINAAAPVGITPPAVRLPSPPESAVEES